MNPEKRKHFTIPVFIPELACPNRCSFCNQNKITGKPEIPKPTQLEAIIMKYLETIPGNSEIGMGFFGGNFTGIPIVEQIEYLEAVQPFISSGKIENIRISTRPDYIDIQILEMLQSFRVKTIEIGAQSMDDEVLRINQRGHSSEDVRIAAGLIKRFNFRLGIQMMCGLPGDNQSKTLSTAQEIVSLGADETRIYPALVIKGTLMEEWFSQGHYMPLSLDEAIEWVKPCILEFDRAGVKILRVGLHPADGLKTGLDLISGPFHPSFRELVYTGIWQDLLKNLTKGDHNNKISIFVAPQSYNVAIGYKAANGKMLLNSFDAVNFYKDPALKNFEFYVNYS